MERSNSITRQQIAYLRLYNQGYTQAQIAETYGVNKSTVSRVLKRAMRHTCPFSDDCEKCPLDECAIKDQYAYLINNTPDQRYCDNSIRTRQRIYDSAGKRKQHFEPELFNNTILLINKNENEEALS